MQAQAEKFIITKPKMEAILNLLAESTLQGKIAMNISQILYSCPAHTESEPEAKNENGI